MRPGPREAPAGDEQRAARPPLAVAAVCIGGAVALGITLRQCAAASAAAERAHDRAVFSASRFAPDPTVRAAILREVRAPAPAGWDEAALATTWQSFAERILDAHTSGIVAVAFAPDGRNGGPRASAARCVGGSSVFLITPSVCSS